MSVNTKYGSPHLKRVGGYKKQPIGPTERFMARGDINKIAANGNTLLHHPDSVVLALTHPDFNLNIDQTNSNGRTALYPNLYYPTFWTLIAYGANIYVQDYEGNTLLHLLFGDRKHALGKIRKTIAQYLVSKGIDINMQDDYGNTPAHLAIVLYQTEFDYYHHKDTKKYKHRGEPIDYNHIKPKHYSYGRLALLRELGADFTIKNNEGESVLDIVADLDIPESRRDRLNSILTG